MQLDFKNKVVPNFIPITNADKFLLNRKRFAMLFMLQPFNRVEGKMDFVKFADSFIVEKGKEEDFQKDF